MTSPTTSAAAILTTTNSSSTEAATWTTALAPEDVQTFLDAESRKTFSQLLPTVIFLVLLSLLGLLGNSVTVLVYYRRYRPSSTRTYILAMAGCDLLSNVWSLPTEALDFRYRYTYTSNTACKISWTGVAVLAAVTCLLLVAVALDRHILICRRPSLAQSYGRKAGKVVVVCAVLAVLISVPQTIIMKINSVPFPDYNVTGSTCSIRITTPREKVVRRVYDIILYTVFFGCVLTMVLCYTTIAYRLWKHAKHVRKNSQSSTDSSGGRTQYSTADSAAVDSGTASQGEAIALRSMARPEHSDVDRHATTEWSETEAASQDHCSQDVGQASSEQPQAQALCQEGQPLNPDSSKSKREAANHISSPAPARGPSSKPKRAGGSVKKIPSRTTLMLFVLTVVFVLNYLPHLSARLLRLADKGSKHTDNVVEIMLRSFYLNGAINPLIYSFCSAKFRRECRHLLRSFCRR